MNTSTLKIKAGILGATGLVGQQFVNLLANHPWFEVTFLASSSKSAGKTYAEGVKGRWHLKEKVPDSLTNTPIFAVEQVEEAKKRCSFVFSALPTAEAGEMEVRYANAGIPVISNAGFHRHTADVPIIIPEINAEHLAILPIQQKSRGWNKGFIVVKPNCSIQSYMIPLHALQKQFGVASIFVATMQALSGAGHPGVSALNILDNLIPYIPEEEEKTQTEPLKIWGDIKGNRIEPAKEIQISAHCNRVPVIDGHTACVSVKFKSKPPKQEILELWRNFQGEPQLLQLPSAPPQPIIYLEEADRPQPSLDRHSGNGMAITVGRLRDCPLFDYRFAALSHNTVRGAAGGAVLTAELLVKKNWIHLNTI